MASFLHRPASTITEADLQSLIENEVHESRNLDFKAALDLGVDKAKKDFLADLTSFANSDGGDILIGVREENGIAAECVGVPAAIFDQTRLKIEQLLEVGVSPRLTNIEIRPVSLSAGSVVMLVRIPKSWNPPHRVELQHEKFYTRTSGRKHLMDVDELRAAFAFGQSLSDRLEMLRRQMVSTIPERMSGIGSHSLVAMHLLPFSVLGRTGRAIPLMIDSSTGFAIRPIGETSLPDLRHTFEGLLGYRLDLTAGAIRAYTQLGRDATIESVSTQLMRVGGSQDQFAGTIATRRLQATIITAGFRFLQALAQREVQWPIACFVSLVNVKGFVSRDERHRREFGDTEFPIQINNLHLPAAIVERPPTDAVAFGAELRVAFDRLWNSMGWPRCLYYDEEGNLADISMLQEWA